MSLPRYPRYTDSGVEWLGEVPGHWNVKRLKHVCHVFPSNVDKKSYEDEMPTRLCNYTDVYYNEAITGDLDFMAATASTDQIAKFTLRADHQGLEAFRCAHRRTVQRGLRRHADDHKSDYSAYRVGHPIDTYEPTQGNRLRDRSLPVPERPRLAVRRRRCRRLRPWERRHCLRRSMPPKRTGQPRSSNGQPARRS